MRDEFKDDLQLARQVAAGDLRALDRFYERYADSLYAFIAHRLAGAREDVEDIWQESLVAALRALPGYQGNSHLFTWLCGIARRKVIDHLRQPGQMDLALTEEADCEASEWTNQAPLPEDWVQQRSTRIQVVMTLQALPEEYRKALIARYADEKSTGEVAHMLGRTYKATESLLSRARSAFHSAFVAKSTGEK